MSRFHVKICWKVTIRASLEVFQTLRSYHPFCYHHINQKLKSSCTYILLKRIFMIFKTWPKLMVIEDRWTIRASRTLFYSKDLSTSHSLSLFSLYFFIFLRRMYSHLHRKHHQTVDTMSRGKKLDSTFSLTSDQSICIASLT